MAGKITEGINEEALEAAWGNNASEGHNIKDHLNLNVTDFKDLDGLDNHYNTVNKVAMKHRDGGGDWEVIFYNG